MSSNSGQIVIRCIAMAWTAKRKPKIKGVFDYDMYEPSRIFLSFITL